jgi:XTP/dITP diphosphohydrolase
VLALAEPSAAGPRGGLPVSVVRGTFRGRIATASKGSNGFGYDPIFEPSDEPPGGRTVGELPADEKNRRSHRAAAARRMAPFLRARGF